MRVRLTPLATFFTLALTLLLGCSANNQTSSGFGGEGGTISNGNGNGNGGNGLGGDCVFCAGGSGQGGGIPVGQLVISPQDPKLFALNNNPPPTQAFTATIDGKDVTTQVTWSFEKPDVGDIGANGTFAATGKVGGVGKLTAKINKVEASTTITVTIKKVVNTAGIDPGTQTALDNPNGGPDVGLQVLYPYNETVFPLAVLAPELQWNGGQPGDIYKLHLSEQYYDYVEYFTAPPPSRHLIPESDWDDFENSGAGAKSDPVQVQITRMSGGTAFQPVVNTWHIAQGRLKGSVYYWELPDACGGASNGKILRISPGSAAVDQFYPTNECYGCHTVSRDGKTMMAAFDTGLPFPQRTIDLTQNPAVAGPSTGLGGTFSAFNDKGDRIVVSNDSASNPSGSVLRIADPMTGAILNPNAMGTGCGEPAWSPDGTKMAAICGLGGGGWIFDATQGYLALADVAPDGVTVTNTHQIIPQGGGPGRPAYPSFSPGSEYIAFGRPTQGSRSTGNGDIWLTDTMGSFAKKLNNAAGDGKSFNPVFAPLRAGGYFWLVFISRRNYGNNLVGNDRQQLWIAAVEDPPTMAADPSHPAFYMRGQEMCGKSENAYYALDPCKPLGADCTSGVDCCDGQCVKDPQTGKYVCGQPPPPGQCSENGNACKSDADCCDPSASCLDGFCTPPTPH